MSNISFSDLLNRAEQLTADVVIGTDLPRIERNLPQLAEASQRLLSKTWTNVGDGSDVKASLLLSSKGVELPKLSQRLESLNATKTFEPIEPVIETDIHGFLKNERENAILATIEETKRKTFENAEKRFWDSLEDNWEKEKQKILNSLLSAGKQALSFPIDSGRYDDYLITKGRSSLSAIEMAYAQQIYVCNEMDLQSQPCRFLDALKQVGNKCDDQNVKDLWSLLEQLVQSFSHNIGGVGKLRQSKDFKIQIVKNAKMFLENRYREFIEKTVYSNLQSAQLGGIPGLFNLIQSFLKIKLIRNGFTFEDGSLNGIPVWPLLYYCLRCGDFEATQEAAEALPPQCSDFKMFLKDYFSSSDGRLQPNNEAKICLEYKRVVRSSRDPFKRIVYCIIGNCDVSDSHSDVAKKIEDYMWLKLNQVQFSDENASDEAITLEDLQKLLLEDYGESHFKAHSQPYLYCLVLFLTGQFETGIEFLSRTDRCRSHAIHFAIALQKLNLLLCPEMIHAPLLSDDPADQAPLKRLNYARLLTIYTRKFEITDLREALEYFYLLRHLNGPNGEDLFASCVSELVLETREFETILGNVNPDGSKKNGCVSKFKLNISEIACVVARDAENKGQLEDAAMLYDLSDNHEKVFELLNNLLCQFISLANSPQSSRDRIQTVSRSIAERYKTRGHNGSRMRSSTFYLLIDLMYFFDLYHEQQFDSALEVMRKIKLIPFSMDEVDFKVTSFKQYSDEVRQCLPDVLLTSMNILFEKFKKSKSTGQDSMMSMRKDEAYLASIRSQARSLVTFAGLLPYRMPGDTNARLVQMEVMIN